MDERNPHMKMFVADVLMDGHESLPNILDFLNDHTLIGWRDTVTCDFTWQDVVSAVEELLRDGLVDLWRDDGGLVEVETDREGVLRSAEEGSERLWVRLTPEGRRAVEEWEPPTKMDEVLMQHLNELEPSPVSLHFIDIADPKVLLEKLIERHPERAWFVERKAVRHIVVGEGDSVTIGIGSVSEFRAYSRWSRGQPESEQGNIRHIVLNEEGQVIGDYFGPASLDPLG